jgi:hypothetical protein
MIGYLFELKPHQRHSISLFFMGWIAQLNLFRHWASFYLFANMFYGFGSPLVVLLFPFLFGHKPKPKPKPSLGCTLFLPSTEALGFF